MKKTIALFLCLLLAASLAAPAFADNVAFAMPCRVEGGFSASIRTYHDSYEGNYYLSLIDTSAALNGSTKQFRYYKGYTQEDGTYYTIQTGLSAAQAGGADSAFASAAVSYLTFSRNKLYVDGQERKYYTHNPGNGDLYMSLADLQLMLDVRVELDESGILVFYPGESYHADLDALVADGFFDQMSAVFLGDADTGEVLYYNNSRTPLPIASTSKLMTYLVIREAIDAGEIKENTWVTFSQKAIDLSQSADGIIKLHKGMGAPVSELIDAMMIASSNESALALAEAICGSEEAFVERMNNRAKELFLSTARFYTCHGLPSYSESTFATKRQSMMSAAQLFELTQTVLEKYPELTQTTARQYLKLENLDYTTANSNPLLFNMPGVNGLKTGNTNRAGYCVVVSMPVTKGEETHTIVLVLLGAETPWLRGQAAEILLRYARDYYAENGFLGTENAA